MSNSKTKPNKVKVNPGKNDIAIVGLACRFPGAGDYTEFWENLVNGVNSIREIPPERWDINEYYSPDINEPNKSVSKWCGLLEKVDQFDNRFFNISPREANNMDPQQRLLLEETWHCIEDSGIGLSHLQNRVTSVFVGVMGVDYLQETAHPEVKTDSYACLGNYECILANRISYFFNLKGSSYSINAACASSLVALHEAKRSLLANESEFALAGGVNLNLHPWKYVSFSKSRMLSPDGQCKPFDQDANGYVPGDGVGVLLLQRLDDALRDGNHIYGIIKGSAVNHCGKSVSITAPRAQAQCEVILEAYKDAQVSPDTIGYIEAHGSGTSLGDPIEIEGLTKAFKNYSSRKNFCKIGSVKSNIGHLESAAGIAGVIKVLLMFKYQKIVPTLNIKTLNPIIDFANSPFAVADRLTDWHHHQGLPLRAGVSSFGFGGVNSHILLEEYYPVAGTTENVPEDNILFLLSAHSPEGLESLTAKWRQFVKSPAFSEANLQDLCLTLLQGRKAFPVRCGALIKNKQDLLDYLQAKTLPISKTPPADWCFKTAALTWEECVLIHKGLLKFRFFRRYLEQVAAKLARIDHHLQLGAFLSQPVRETQRDLYAFSIGYALLQGLIDLGFRPELITWEPGGIWAALVISKMLTVEEALALLCGKKDWTQVQMLRPSIPVFDPVAQQIWSPYRFDAPYLEALFKDLQLSDQSREYYLGKARNLYRNQYTFKRFMEEWNPVLAGLEVTIEQLLFAEAFPDGKLSNPNLLLMVIIASSLTKINQKWDLTKHPVAQDARFTELLDLVIDDVISKELLVSLMSSPPADLTAVAATINGRQQRVNSGKPYQLLKSHSKLLPENFECCAWFKVTAVAWPTALVKSYAWFNLGAGQDEPADQQLKLGGSNDFGADLKAVLLESWLQGINLRWDELYAGITFQKLPLPVYPFQRNAFWLTHDVAKSEVAQLHPVLDANTSTLEEQRYTTYLDSRKFYLRDHVIGGHLILPGVVYLEMARAAGELAGNGKVGKLKNIIWTRPVELEGSLGKYDSKTVHISLHPAGEAVDYQVWSGDAAAGRVGHSQGKIYYDTPVGPAESGDCAAVKERCLHLKSKADCYRLLELQGYRYGAGLQAIDEFYSNEQEALAYLKLPPADVVEAQQYTLHPAIMDGALQAAILFLATLPGETERLYLPFALGELAIWAGTGEKCYCHVTLGGANPGPADLLKLNISILSEQGAVLVKFSDLTVRASQTPAAQLPVVPAGQVYFQKQWVLQPESVTGEQTLAESLLVFSDDQALWQLINESPCLKGSQVVIVKPGKEFKQLGPDQYEVAPACPADYQQLWQALTEQKRLPRRILHFWSREAFSPDEASLGRQLDRSLFSLFGLTQGLLEQKPSAKVRLLYLYQNQAGEFQPQYAAVSGFIKTVNLENPKLSYKSIELGEALQTVAQLESILAEFATDGAVEIRYSDGARWINTLQEFTPEQSPVEASALPLKTDGVYLITGGAGGLGLMVANFIASQVQAKLVLTGRSPLTPERERQLEALRALGSEVVYLQGDLAQRSAVTALLQQIKTQFSAIHGIIHCAGVIRDALLPNKSAAAVAEVIAPKVQGTVFLDELTAAEPLDFMVLFASFVGLLGNLGQSDYAYANCFLSEYADLRESWRQQGRRNGKTLAISWPLWQSGGMQVGKETETRFFNSFGMRPLQAEMGLAVFSQGLQGPAAHFLVMAGEVNRIRKALATAASSEAAEAPGLSCQTPVCAEDLLEKIRQDLKIGVSQILEIPEADLDLAAKMSEFGFDSVSYTQFSNWLNELYTTNIMPSVFFEYPTLERFAEYLASEYQAQLVRFYQVEVKMEDLAASLEKPAATPVPVNARFRPAVSAFPARPAAEDPVAIIGMGGVMPGSDDLAEFWRNLMAGEDLITTIPEERWDWRRYYGDPAQEPNKTNVKWGGFIRGVDQFDPLFFGISPREAELMDPQHRLFLETVWQTIEDAGYKASELAGSNTGLFVGVATNDYHELLVANSVDLQAQTPTGVFHSVLANRISYLFDFHGPSEPVDTACSSSLVAIQKAVAALKSGACELAIAGGVNAILTPALHIAFGKAGMLCADGRCKTFDQKANGYVRGEGCGAVLLKPLSKALADGDQIYAVIKAVGVNHGGRTNSLTAPNPNAQADLIYDAWDQSGIDPTTVSYLETHGTGTALGDPIEINGLKKAFGRLYEKWGKPAPTEPHCGLGSVKTNVGHLEAAAGIAGVLKILLALKYQKLPKLLHFQTLNPYIGLEGSPFFIVKQNMAWENRRDPLGNPLPRRAGVSSFGFGGVNAHVVLEEYPMPVETERTADSQERIYVFSARNEERLRVYIEKMIAALTEPSDSPSPEASLVVLVQRDLTALAAALLNVAAEGLRPEEDLTEYGFDEVGFTQLAEQIQAKYRLEGASAMFSGFLTLEALAGYLVTQYPEVFNDYYQGELSELARRENTAVAGSTVDPARVAYTLQVGREALEERLAIVAADLNELVSKLTRYYHGATEIDRLFRGNARDNKETKGLLTGPEGEARLRQMVADHKLDQLAELWVAGAEVNWRLCYPRLPQRLALPTYPFARERYWLPQTTGGRTKLSPTETDGPFYYETAWEAASLTEAVRPQAFQSVLVFNAQPETYEALQQKLAGQTRCLLVISGAHYERRAAGVYVINPQHAQDYQRLLAELQQEGELPDGLIYLGSKPEVSLENAGEYSAALFNQQIGPVFYLIQAFRANRVNSLKQLLLVTEGEAPHADPASGILAGYGGSLGLVWPELLVKSLVIQDGPGAVALAERIAAELVNGAAQSEICYHQGVRLVKRVKSLSLTTDAGSLPVKRGVYLITGGAGGLGLIFARYLAEQYQARLVLIGRSPLNESIEAKVRQLQELGGEAWYRRADVSDRAAMEQVIAGVKERWGGLNGVLHAAGILSRQTVLEKETPDFTATLQPKLSGTLVLDQVTQDQPLDFFMLFSSVAAHLGDFGQCDYAIANRFLDNYVVYRETQRAKQAVKGRTIGINWPLWKTGGMHFDPEGEALYLQTSGMTYLESAAGLKAFEAILQSGRSQVLVLAGERSRIDRLLGLARVAAPPELLSEAQVPVERMRHGGGNQPEGDPEQRLVRELRELAADMLKLNYTQVDPRRNLGEFGFDSISLKEYASAIKDRYRISLSPTVFFAHSSLQSLSNYLLKEYAGPIREFYTQAGPGLPSQEDGAGRVSDGAVCQPVAAAVRNSAGQSEGKTAKEPVAIIGISGVFPGAKNLTEFWENLAQGKDAISEIPKERWDYRKYYGDPVTGKNVSHSKWGGFIVDVDKFDAPFYSISPREAELMDPQHRLFVETVWKTIEDAGYQASQLSGRKMGVFAGVQFKDYQDLMESVELQAQIATGNFHALLSNRISYLFNFKGPSESIDTACSSSLVAVHRAVKSIQNGESEWAIAGGVNLLLSPATFVVAGKLGILSPDGRCKTFDKDANGYVRGEGVGAVLLKPLSQAVRDRDHIYAVIRGTAENHGGRANSLTAPNSEAQADLLVAAYQEAACDIKTVTYIETHGTGTELGDPVEVEGLKKAFQQLAAAAPESGGSPKYYCGLGSVKTNIGHLEPAAGIAGLIKVVLAMQHRKLPGILHFKELNPYLELAETPFYIVKESQAWRRLKDAQGAEIPLRAGVSSFGFGGTNAHVVLEEYQAPDQVEAQGDQPQIVVLSAKNEQRLKAYVGELLAYLAEPQPSGEVSMLNLAFTLNTGREPLEERLAVVVASLAELREVLTGYAQNVTDHAGLYRGNVKRNRLDPDQTPSEAELAALIDRRQLRRLGELWVAGVTVDWERLYTGQAPHRVSLPTYPFERRRYWFDSFLESAVVSCPVAPGAPPATVASNPGKNTVITSAPKALSAQGNEVTLRVVDEVIGLVVIEDRQNANMFTANVLNGLVARFEEIRRNPAIKVVIVTGYDHVFCMGGTQDFLTEIANLEEKCSSVPFVYEGLLKCPVPVIAAMQGHAYGGGLIFGLFADLIVMAEEGVYSANFTKYGFTPGVGSTLILKEKLGSILAAEMMFTGKSFSGAELKNRGAAPRFCKQREVLSEAFAIARSLTDKPLKTLMTLKQELSRRILEQLPAILASEVRMHDAVFSAIDVNSLIQYHFNSHGSAPKGKQPPTRLPAQTAPCAAQGAAADLQAVLVGIVAKILHLDPAEINYQSTFKELGIDSISGVEVIRDVNAAFRLNLEVVTLYDYVSIDEFAGLISSELTKGQITGRSDQGGAAGPAEQSREYRESGYRTVRPRPEGSAASRETTATGDLAAIQAVLVGIIAKILHLEATEINDQSTFKELGIDSISGVEVIRDVNAAFRLNLEVVSLYDYVSINEFAGLIGSELTRRQVTERRVMGDPVIPAEQSRTSGYRTVKPGKREQSSREVAQPGAAGAVQTVVAEIIANILHMQVEAVDVRATFKDLGIDSISGVEIIRDINQAFNLNCEVVILYDYPSTAELAQYLAGIIRSQSAVLPEWTGERTEPAEQSVFNPVAAAGESGSTKRIALKMKSSPQPANAPLPAAPTSQAGAPATPKKVALKHTDDNEILQLLQRLSTEELDVNEVDQSLEEIL